MPDQESDLPEVTPHPTLLGVADLVGSRPELRTTSRTRPAPGVAAILVSCVLSRTLGPRLMRRLQAPDRPVLLCLQVPDKSWFDPLREATKSMPHIPAVRSWDATARRTSGDPSIGEVMQQLTGGRSVLCVSQEVAATLPRAVRTTADATLPLSGPEPADIALAISLVRGGRPPSRVSTDLGMGLQLLEVAACLRRDDAPRVMVDRIRRAMTSGRRSGADPTAPRLEDLHGYGEAAVWARRVMADVAALREGRLSWCDVTGPAVLHGPPGTGKTLFPRALARSLDAPLVATSVGAWFQTGTGDLGATVRAATAVFEEARAAAREHGVAVLFLDEVDGLPNRMALDAREGSWWRPVVNHVLTLVDGATSDLRGIVLVAATNDIAAVDPALLRPGRFGTALEVLPPTAEDLAGVVLHHLGGTACPLTRTEVTAVLRPLAGATQARAAAWAAEASRTAREAGRPVTLGDLVAVVRPRDQRSPSARLRVATHEAGHAVAAWHLDRHRVVAVSIVETSDSHGVMARTPRDDSMLTRAEVEDEVVIVLSGRAADVVVGDGANAGAGGDNVDASSDLSVATRRLTAVHATLGLGPTLRHRRNSGVVADPEVAALVEADLQRLMTRAEQATAARAAEVRAVADALLEHGFLTAADLGRVIAAP